MPSRRSVLASVGGVVAGSLAGCQGYRQQQGGLGGGVAASGGVGSGFAYEQPAITREDAHVTVTTPDQLDTALDVGTPENPVVVWVPADAAINYSGRSRLVENAIITSTRTVNHPGGMIYTSSIGQDSSAFRGGPVNGMFELGENVRLTGLRIRGPTSAVWNHPLFPGYIPYASGSASVRDAFRRRRHSRGLTITSGAVRLDNVEVFGWSTQAISVNCPRSYGRERAQSYPRIQNFSIHDNGLSGYGYGVEVNVGHPIMERGYFNGCRHMVAGEGFPDGGYTLSGCFFGPAGSLFPIDMHLIGETFDGSSDPDAYDYRYHAGELIRVLGCTVAFSHVIDIAASSSISAGGNPFAGNQTPAIHIGAVPSVGAVIKGNRFVHDSRESAITQGHVPPHVELGPLGYGRFELAGNQFGLPTNYSVGQG